ncbi:metal-dependent hydrolase [Acinetobacter tjernbergiae]|uniref:Phospholipase C/D domain-containing protein n=1 Tax=Acinetobacter tjernbergiae DSM 14971 = CIP 107465 TaxID=1120928 RepID=V2ULV8_9GAMM|nr:metal-dependent hydrolase [Acinetobacter tjernbergiae]ESK55718.1 hypothetical protein F990_01602 [Acinetobacter tjernbergiae DSM 14971 = CIP 107465]
MFIAHLPSGYILAKALYSKLHSTGIQTKSFFTIIMLGAIFPDLNLFYFYLIDQRSVHHHQYFPHWLSVWITIFLIALYCFKSFKSKFALLTCLFCSGAILHIFLDLFVGDVWLFAPFIHQSYAFFEVSSRYPTWWLNFILHWSFLIEILICLRALFVYFKSTKAAMNSLNTHGSDT